MAAQRPVRILFTGYAPVHFICFQPLYRRLKALPGVEVFVSGGIQTKIEPAPGSGGEAKVLHDHEALYGPFGLPADRVLSVEEIRQQDFDVLFSAHTKLILPKSVARRVQIFHGVSFRNRAVRPENMNCDHYFLVGPYMRRRFLEGGLMAEDDPRIVEVGFMKTDPLLDGSLDRARVRGELGFSGQRPVLLYAPTGARMNSLETVGEEVITKILATGRYDLVLKLHDHAKNDIDWPARLAPLTGEHFRIEQAGDVVPLMLAADALISDASSVTNEYAMLDRPIVFIDTPELIEKAKKAESSMLDLNTWGRKSGVVVERPDQVVAALDHGIAQGDGCSATRRAIVQDLFYNPGHAADAAMQWVTTHLLASTAARA